MCRCYGYRGSGISSDWSNDVTLTVFERPKAVLTVKPEPSQIFRGETVSLTCDIQGEGWTYRWDCDGSVHTSNTKEFRITAERTQMCRCYGYRGSGISSDWSNDVTLTVFERPKAVLTVKREPSQIFRGETVTLTCDIQGEGWTYRWDCDGRGDTSNTKEFRITAERTQMCRCYGYRGSGISSDWSNDVTLTVFERPKAVLTVKREPSQIFRGETVTLTCDIQGEGWTYRWDCDGSDHTSNTKEFRITAERTQMCRCYGYRGSGISSDWSNDVTLTVFERPKAVLTVKPEPSQIFRGETVTLTCDIQGEGWTYRWDCDGRGDTSNTKEFRITAERTQMCRCYGYRGSGISSDWSNDVTLTVFDKPRVRVKPQSSVFTGDTVTLSCDVRRSTGRRIIWYKDSKIIKTGDEMNIPRNVRLSDGGEYWCGVENSTDGHRVTLTVRERPKAVLRVHPDGRVFRGQTVTLTCDIQETDVTRWTYTWNKDNSEIHDSQSQEYRISSVSESHTGHYSCRGRETGGSRHTHTSDEVTLTLSAHSERPKAVLRVHPDGRVFRGQTVTLTCDIQETDVTRWTYTWNKDNSEIHDSQSQEYRISFVNESHTGHYSCRGRETGGSRHTHTSDEATLTLSDLSGSEAPLPVLSALKLVSFLLAASPYLLVTVIIGVKYYRAHVCRD
ncbi:B-cell receptor CD22-like [Pseudorasbora parva]|uniref:B-cell receptor CD22-like n=1 Tax=Pseudorasbora parva TaxID=51549 RepID=UPI00351F7BD9